MTPFERTDRQRVRTRATVNGRRELHIDQALMDAADAIADMAQRVQLNGPEPVYASEKLSFAVYKAAEGLALCDAELDEVTEEARRGYQHGIWVKEDAR
jgi:chemotaxis regulatin CheY-phosphate phosphatase CheZ